MHTEEQAKKLWCPHVRVSDGEGYASENRTCQAGKVIHSAEASWCNCIASACMMWREAGKNEIGSEPHAVKSEFDLQTRIVQKKIYEAYGYCGLAGKPSVE